MTAASNSEARKRAAGIAASVPTAQEPTPTLGDAPGADSEALAALLDQIACAIRDEWEPGSRIEWAEQHARSALGAVLASSWLADHDRQIAERAWDEGYWTGRDDEVFDQRGLSTDSDAHEYPHDNPYSEEARRG